MVDCTESKHSSHQVKLLLQAQPKPRLLIKALSLELLLLLFF